VFSWLIFSSEHVEGHILDGEGREWKSAQPWRVIIKMTTGRKEEESVVYSFEAENRGLQAWGFRKEKEKKGIKAGRF